jgi:hypothetical protein
MRLEKRTGESMKKQEMVGYQVAPHNSALAVRVGQEVIRGQFISESGTTGGVVGDVLFGASDIGSLLNSTDIRRARAN